MCISFHTKPKYKIFHAVWAISRINNECRVSCVEIRSIICEMHRYEEENGNIVEKLITLGYTTSPLTYNQLASPFYEYEENLFASEKIAKKYAKWQEVKLPQSVYKKALGIDSNDNRIDIQDSELGTCCSDISAIRDLLIQCKKSQGLCKYDCNLLQKLINNHGVGDGKNLSKILSALGLKIKQSIKDDPC